MLTPEQVKSAISVYDVAASSMELEKTHEGWKGRCPFHEEKTGSFTIYDEGRAFKCFGCGAAGDVIEFVRRRENVTFPRALAILAERIGQDPKPTARQRRGKKALQAQPVLPVPEDAPPPTFQHARLGAPSRTWTYRDAAGRVLGYVCRFDREGGGKEVLPRHFIPGTGPGTGWAWVSAPKPRPLYGLELLVARPQASVVVVEGEKACDAARQLLPGQVVVTWPGGGKAVKYGDWTPLRGRKVLVWPDCDRQKYPPKHERAGQEMPPLEQPGMVAAMEIAGILERLACQVRIAKVFA